MTYKYQVVIRVRSARTLNVLGSVVVYESTLRDMAQHIMDDGMYVFQPIIDALRHALPKARVTTEMVTLDSAEIDIIDAAQKFAMELRRDSGFRAYLSDGNMNLVGIIRAAWAHPPDGKVAKVKNKK